MPGRAGAVEKTRRSKSIRSPAVRPAGEGGAAECPPQTTARRKLEETKELIAGYTIIKARSREEAMEWTRRFPNPAHYGKEDAIEVRQLFELDDFEQTDCVKRFRDLGVGEK